MGLIKLVNVSKSFGNRKILDVLSLNIRKNEIFGILGASGAGKTTLLRVIAGLETPERGEIFIDRECVCGEKFVPPEKRSVGLVFQNLALWPHMTVREHLDFVLQSKKLSNQERETKIKEILRLVGLSKYPDSYPTQLSGGEKQRVAIARVLAQEPKVLLLDEPLSDVDQILKQEIKKELVKIQRKLGLTVVYVTHNSTEILDIADRIAILQNGRIIQIGKPKEVCANPESEFVAKILDLRSNLRQDQRPFIDLK